MNRALLIYIFLIVCTVSFGQTICIDPGHGYTEDGGNEDDRTWEEISTNLAVGLLLEDSLTARGYTVIMTRENSDSGSWMSLTQRAELADFYESDRLLSIHCNGGGGTGTETFWNRVNTESHREDSAFSSIVQNKMSEIGEWRSRRSVEDYIYLKFSLGVLKGYATGCLNEIGFVDTESDLEKLLDYEWRQTFAQAYAVAIDESMGIDYPSSQTEIELEASIYPNPFTNHIEINSTTELVEYSLIDISGKVISLTEIQTNSTSIRLNTEAISSGIYFLSLTNSKGQRTYKLLKY